MWFAYICGDGLPQAQTFITSKPATKTENGICVCQDYPKNSHAEISQATSPYASIDLAVRTCVG